MAFARFAVAIAIPTFWRMPLEYVPARRLAASPGNPACVRNASSCCLLYFLAACESGEIFQVLDSSECAVTSNPLTLAAPELGSIMFRNRLMVLVLPAPLAPSRQNTSPGSILRFKDWSAAC